MEGDKSSGAKSCCSGGACGSAASSTVIKSSNCKCGDDWTCEVTKVSDDDYKPFYKCNQGSCKCVVVEGGDQSKVGSGEEEKGVDASSAYIECGVGYKCTVTKKGADKSFFECGNGCKCEISGNKVTVCYT